MDFRQFGNYVAFTKQAGIPGKLWGAMKGIGRAVSGRGGRAWKLGRMARKAKGVRGAARKKFLAEAGKELGHELPVKVRAARRALTREAGRLRAANPTLMGLVGTGATGTAGLGAYGIYKAKTDPRYKRGPQAEEA
jgi:hypothetical protein